MNEFAVEMKGIEKSFGSNKVLHGVDFFLKKGSIHALLGENGTGKTTLMNILGGVIAGDSGEVLLDGEVVLSHQGMLQSREDIAFIHQELTLINHLNVFENLFIGRECVRLGRLDKKRMYEEAKKILDKMEIDLDPSTVVAQVNASYKQVIEIARALMKNAKIIIMDEPTTSLTNVEIEHIFGIMNGLKKQGVSFIFISHKLKEVMEICDSYTVMRDGRVISSGSVNDQINENELAKLMVGKELAYDDMFVDREIGEPILQVAGLSREREFNNIDFKVGKGEIVGFTGLLGDGRSELFNTIYGCRKKYDGEILISGKKHKMNSTMKARKMKISYLPRNRKENGIIKDLSVEKNMSIAIAHNLRKWLFVHPKKEREFSEKHVEMLKIKVADLNAKITSLSGGNQQKVILARALSSKPDIVILDNPTQGVDVGAKLEIYNIIMKLAQEGISFVVLSSEAQEVLMLCDRIYVMYHGEIKSEFHRKDANEERIMIVATGGKVEQ